MYEVLMYDGGVYRVNELYELVEDVGGFVIQKTQIQVQILVTMAIPEEERPVIEAKTRELGGKIVHVPLAGTEVAVVAPTLGRHHMPHPTCDIAEQLRRLGAITVVMGLARGKGRRTSQISADEKAIIEEYDAAVFVLGNFKDCILEHRSSCSRRSRSRWSWCADRRWTTCRTARPSYAVSAERSRGCAERRRSPG